MALSDEIKGIYDQLDAMVFAAEALQKCLADPDCYKPYHGSDAKQKILELQMSINSSIKSLQDKMSEMHQSMSEMPEKVAYSSLEIARSSNPEDFLVVEDKEKPTTWHLQVKKNGEYNRGLCGAAWAALHEGFRGNKYEGPKKQEALKKLKSIYKKMGWPLPTE